MPLRHDGSKNSSSIHWFGNGADAVFRQNSVLLVIAARAGMVFLDQNVFMSELSKLYTENKTKGSVWITMKRVERAMNTGKHKLDLQPPFCLVRATDGKRKLACVVSTGDHLRFHMDLFTIIKANATNLQKPKRTRKNNNSSN